VHDDATVDLMPSSSSSIFDRARQYQAATLRYLKLPTVHDDATVDLKLQTVHGDAKQQLFDI